MLGILGALCVCIERVVYKGDNLKILFLSDLHLGSPLFKHKDEVISLIQGDYDKVIMVGDILDVWEKAAYDIYVENEELATAFNTLDDLTIIKGNHDPDLETLRMFFPNADVLVDYEFSYEGEKIKVIHGEEFDYQVGSFYWLARILFPIQWLCSRIGLNCKGRVRDLLHSFSAKVQDKQYNDLIQAVEKEAVNKYKVNYSVLIMGHTHLPKFVVGPCTYINTGDWITHNTYVVFEDGKFSLKGDY